MVERFGLSGDVQYGWSMDGAHITRSRDGMIHDLALTAERE
ncbi:hypothetical protein ACFXB4_00775 [Streptomyces lavendulae]